MNRRGGVSPFGHVARCTIPAPRGVLRLLIIAAAYLCLAHSPGASAQATAPAQLPPAAQEALDKGIIAAKVPDYLLAIRYFEEARKAAPAAPIVFLNLGLAESRIPSRELRAIAWFAAYLAAYPDASNAAAVKEQIAALEVRNQSNVSRLLTSLQDAANQMPNNRDLCQGEVASLWAKAGDSKTARKIAEGIGDADYKGATRVDVGVAQARLGDAAGALEAAGLMQDASWKSLAQIRVAQVQTEAADFAGAQETLAHAQETAGLVSVAALKEGRLSDLAQAQGALVKAQAAGPSDASDPAREPTPDARSASEPAVKVSDWLALLDGSAGHFPLNSEPFLDLAGHLKSLPPADNPRDVFTSLRDTVEKIVKAQSVIHQMLKQQARQ